MIPLLVGAPAGLWLPGAVVVAVGFMPACLRISSGWKSLLTGSLSSEHSSSSKSGESSLIGVAVAAAA